MTLEQLANDPKLLAEVEALAQDIYSSLKEGSGQPMSIARCWVLATNTILQDVNSGIKVYKPDNVIKLKGR
jgi:hypothetical protein